MERLSVTVIGTGALGAVLAQALQNNGYPIRSLYNRRMRKAEILSRCMDARFVSDFPEKVAELGTLVFCTVQDEEIEPLAHQLSQLSRDLSGYTFAHCSGTLSTEILHPLKTKGAEVAAFHPLQTFTSRSTPEDFRDIYFDIEADEEVFDQLQEVAVSLGAHSLSIPAEAKPFLHAAAVFASNYIVTLLNASGKVASMGGLNKNEALEAILPLVQTTVQNVENEGPLRALSGPIKRGDVETVRKHLMLLDKDEHLKNLYKKLGIQTLDMVAQSNKIPAGKAKKLYRLFEQDGLENNQ